MGMDAGDLLFCIAQTGELLKKQFFHNAGENLQEVAGKLQELLLRFSQEYQGKDEETRDILQVSMDTIGAVIGAMENQDYILCADLLETELYPIVELIVQSLEEPESPVPDGEAARAYRLERARSGDLTIKTKDDPGFYLHSRGNPRREARVWIDGILELGKEAYVVFGIGLGYHVEAIYEKVAGRSRIEVYETDREMIRLAYEYGRMKKINGDSVKAVHDRDGRLFAEAISGRDVQIIMHYPSIKKIEDRNIRASFEKFFISDSTVKETKDLMFMNYKSNTALCRHNADGILPGDRREKSDHSGGGSFSGQKCPFTEKGKPGFYHNCRGNRFRETGTDGNHTRLCGVYGRTGENLPADGRSASFRSERTHHCRIYGMLEIYQIL